MNINEQRELEAKLKVTYEARKEKMELLMEALIVKVALHLGVLGVAISFSMSVGRAFLLSVSLNLLFTFGRYLFIEGD